MPDRPEVTIEDFSRLLSEFGFNMKPEEFFEQNNLSEEILRSLVYSGKKAVTGLMISAMANGEDDPGEIMENIAATMLSGGFAMGWEAHKQFGSE